MQVGADTALAVMLYLEGSESSHILKPNLHDQSATASMQVGGYEVPRGTEVNLSIWCLHHSEQWWQDAETFKPERWLGDETGGDMSGGFAYIPFGVGPRHCIGYKLARRCLALLSIFDVV